MSGLEENLLERSSTRSFQTIPIIREFMFKSENLLLFHIINHDRYGISLTKRTLIDKCIKRNY